MKSASPGVYGVCTASAFSDTGKRGALLDFLRAPSSGACVHGLPPLKRLLARPFVVDFFSPPPARPLSADHRNDPSACPLTPPPLPLRGQLLVRLVAGICGAGGLGLLTWALARQIMDPAMRLASVGAGLGLVASAVLC